LPPALDSGRRLRGRGRWGIHDYLEAAGHGDNEQGPLFRPIRNNRTGLTDKALVAEGRHRGAVVMLRKLAAYRRQNQLDLALQELGRIERTLFISTVSNARNCADAAMPGSIRASSVISSRMSSAPSSKTGKQDRIADPSAEAQQFRASGLNLVIAAIVFWNSTYIADAIAHLRATEQSVPDAWLAHIAAQLGAHRLLRRFPVASRCMTRDFLGPFGRSIV
jgi:hypothetical protein